MASQEIGALGPGQSEPVQVTCERLAGLPTLLPWIVVGVLLIARSSRNRGHAAVLIPLIVIFLLWSLAAQILPFDSIPMTLLAQGIGDFSAAVAVLWLIMDGLTRRSRWKACLPSLVIMIGIGSLAALADSSNTDSEMTTSRIVCVAVAALAGCGSLMLAAWCSGRRPLGGRFLAWLLAWLLLITVGGILAAAAILILIEDCSLQWFFARITDVLFASLVISGAVSLVILPFIVLAMQSLFHRQRLEAYVGANPHPAPGPDEAAL